MNDSRSPVLNKIWRNIRPKPIPESELPIAIAVMAVALIAACGFLFYGASISVFLLPVATALAIGYRWRFIACSQLLMAVLFAREVSFPMPGVPLSAANGIFFFFLPGILLPYLTLRWLVGLEFSERRTIAHPPERRWESPVVAVLFVVLLFVVAIVCLHSVNRTLGFGGYFKLRPEGVSLIALVLLFASGFVLTFGGLTYYRIVNNDQRQLRLRLHQILHKCCRQEERLLFRKRRKAITPTKKAR